MLAKIGEWLIGIIIKYLMGRALDEGEAFVDRKKDEKTADQNAAKLKDTIKKPGVTDEELEKAALDLTNGNP